MTALAALIRGFAGMLAPDPGNAGRLREWITATRAADLPHVHAFTRGLDLDIQAVTAALTMPFHNGRTEGVNTRTKANRVGDGVAPPPPTPPDMRARIRRFVKPSD